MRQNARSPPPLPWVRIQKEVEDVAREIAKSRFINVKHIVEHIEKNEAQFPNLFAASEWHPQAKITTRTLQVRVNEAITRMDWPSWNSKRGTGPSGRIFILPWVPEDPVVVSAREAEA